MLRPEQSKQVHKDFMNMYENEADTLFRFVFFRTRDRESALDIVQDTFLRTWRYLTEGNSIPELRAFLFQTARNVIIDVWRKNGRRATHSLDAFLDEGGDIAEESPSLEFDPLDVERAVKLLSELEPTEYREAVYLRFIEELSPKEIAGVLGVSENVASVRIHRGIKKLNTQFAL